MGDARSPGSMRTSPQMLQRFEPRSRSRVAVMRGSTEVDAFELVGEPDAALDRVADHLRFLARHQPETWSGRFRLLAHGQEREVEV